MKIFTQILFISLSLLLVTNAYAYENEKVIELSSVPKKIMNVATQKVSGIELVSAKLSEARKGVIYELKGKMDDRGYEIKINEKGKIVEYQMDENIPLLLSEIPNKVKEAVTSEVKGSVIVEAEVKRTGKEFYRLEVLSGEDRYDMVVDNYGEVRKIEQENDDGWDSEDNESGREEDDD